MKHVNEKDFQYRGGKSGVKYLMRGPSIDWGLILLKPGEKMAEKAHTHKLLDETFYFVEGEGVMIVNDKHLTALEGSVFLVEPNETHNIRNDSEDKIKIVFIKSDYKPNDKY